MKKITSWAVASAAMAMAMLAACEVSVTDDNPDGGTSTTSTSSGSAGSAGSTSTTATGTGGTAGTGGAGGSDSDGGTCAPSATATECEKCAFDKCMTEICACNDVASCKSAVGDYLTCLISLDGGNMESCGSDFTIAAAGAATQANDLGSCMGDNDCESRCQGRDGGQ